MSTTTNGSATAKKIEFIQFHEPALEDGDYEITVTQTIQSTDNNVPKTEFPSAPTKFSVAGPRFSLSPQEIHSVFPPDGSLGEHSNVLPHIILNRSTLPWERLAVEGQTPPCPWLALLLFDDDEKPTPQVVQLKTLTESAVNPAWPGVTEESAQHDDDKVTVIDIPKNLLTGIAPTASDLCWLTHIRQTYFTLAIERKSDLNTGVLSEELRSAFKDNGVALSSKTTILVKAADSEWEIHDEGNAGVFAISPDKEPATELQVRDASQDELAVVICNRLPQQSGTSTVHLVSVEGRYNKDGFDLQGAGDTVRLVSLKSWSFSCVDEKQTFQNLLLNLDRNPSTLRLPDSAVIQANPAATRAVGAGLVPLPHFIREGSKTVSWYHGPLVPKASDTEIDLPVRAADQLVRYDTTYGMFDVSYASAWELGRLLALQSNNFSVNLFNWKRQHANDLRSAEQQEIHPHLPSYATVTQSNEPTPVPDDINDWFWDLSLLKGLPFNYLLPDERMLPPESIRFFQVDPLWIECLMDGAFSVGRVSDADHARDAAHETSPAANPHGPITGLLLRSNVVSGWPGLLVDAPADDIGSMPDENKLELLRMDRLSPNVLICLFDGEIKTVDIHQKPETLHFGLDTKTDQSKVFEKILRDSEGTENEKHGIDEIPWQTQDKLVVGISGLASKMNDQAIGKSPTNLGFDKFTSAEFALEMIEGVQLVRFQRSA